MQERLSKQAGGAWSRWALRPFHFTLCQVTSSLPGGHAARHTVGAQRVFAEWRNEDPSVSTQNSLVTPFQKRPQKPMASSSSAW